MPRWHHPSSCPRRARLRAAQPGQTTRRQERTRSPFWPWQLRCGCARNGGEGSASAKLSHHIKRACQLRPLSPYSAALARAYLLPTLFAPRADHAKPVVLVILRDHHCPLPAPPTARRAEGHRPPRSAHPLPGARRVSWAMCIPLERFLLSLFFPPRLCRRGGTEGQGCFRGRGPRDGPFAFASDDCGKVLPHRPPTKYDPDWRFTSCLTAPACCFARPHPLL